MSEPPIVDPARGAIKAEPAEHILQFRIRQQEILAELGVLGLQGTPFPELIERAVVVTGEGLEAEFCKVLEYQSAENRFLVRAGVGWGEGVVGKATVGADADSPAGFALQTGKPVISNHLGAEDRFRTPELLLRYGIHRAMNVILQGDGAPYGVLEVDSRSKGEFSEHDIAFLQGVANILGMTIERQRIERDLKAARDRNELLFKEVNHRVKNSLQLVNSMLHLQGRSIDDPKIRAPLEAASSRIAAIARTHERMYRTEAIGKIDLGAFLSEIGHDLDEMAAHCEVMVDAERGVEIAMDQAIPLALLVNELIINASQHAYPGGEAGTVWVTMAKGCKNEIIISVRDKGRGLPPDFDPHKGKGLGMRIVTAFVGQLGADIELHRRHPGVEITVKIPVAPPAAP